MGWLDSYKSMDHRAVQELLEEYVLGLLDPATQRQVEEHLAGCATCRPLYQEYATLAATLPGALATVSPHQLPATVKARLLLQVNQSVAPAAPSLAPRPEAVSTPPPAVQRPMNRKRGWRAWLEPSPGRGLRWALALACLLLVVTLAWSIRLNVALARERALRTEFMELVGRQHELVLEIVDSGKTTRRVLRATDPDSRAYGKVFTRSDMPQVVAMAARLPQPPPGQAYHLWLTEGDQTVLAGVMKIDHEGFAILIYAANRNGPEYTRAQLTLQLVGADTPLGDPILTWQIDG